MGKRSDGTWPTSVARMQRMLQVAFTRVARLQRRMDEFRPHPTGLEAAQKLRTAIDALQAALDAIDKVPPDWRAHQVAPEPDVTVGATVAIKPEAREDYDGLVLPAEMDSLAVRAFRGDRAACATATGAHLFIPTKDLRVVR